MTSPMPAKRRPEPPSTRMQRISLAPVLSATRSRDSCWITVSPSESVSALSRTRLQSCCCWLPALDRLAAVQSVLLRLLQHLDDAPALGGRQRPGLHEQDAVADAAGVLLVVRLELVGAAQGLLVQRVLHAVLDSDDDGLVHLVADHQALTDLAEATSLI